MNKFYMNGKLIHKASDHNTKRCEVEKWVFLPHSDFERLKANPYQEHEAITAARDLMYEDKNAYHCIMLLDEYGDDGLLIEVEGFDYPRLSMFVPDAKSIFDRYQTSESELKLHDMIKDTVEKIAELAHTDKTDLTSADMIDMDEVESLVKDAIVQQLAMRNDIKMAKNTDIGVDFQPDIHVEAEKLTELKFYCPLKVQREIQPTFDEDGEDELFEDTEELSDFEVLEYESEITSAIEAYQSDEEENRGIMAYLGDRKRFADKVYSIFPSVEKVGDSLMGVFTYIYQTIFNSDVRCINGIKKLLADRFMEFSDKLVLNTSLERKPTELAVKGCIIEKAISVSHRKFEAITKYSKYPDH